MTPKERSVKEPDDRHEQKVQEESREATECEIDEAVDESFPASDPPALHLEKDR